MTTTSSNITFRPAVREDVGLWINLIGPSGSGKTYTAFRLAAGIAGDKPFAVIDTENRRALHYADQFKFDHLELQPPFRPGSYAEAVRAADEAGYPVIVIDSGSHVWAGEGGVLDWQEECFKEMGSRESMKMASWAKPKMAHKKMVNEFLRVKAHIILCLRAEEKIEMAKENGKTVVRQKVSFTGKNGMIPICDKNLPFEATVSFLLHVDKPGVPDPIKLQEQHKALFPLDKPITEDSGKRLAEWAAGSGKKPEVLDLQTRRTNMLNHFAGLGVSEERILRAVNVAFVGEILEDEIATLKLLATDLKNGDMTLDVAFPTAAPEAPVTESAPDLVRDETVAEEAPTEELKAGDSITFETKVGDQKEESLHADMLAVATEKAADAKKNDKALLKKMDEFVGAGKVLKNLSLDELIAFNDTF